jgi:hypothetical protein
VFGVVYIDIHRYLDILGLLLYIFIFDIFQFQHSGDFSVLRQLAEVQNRGDTNEMNEKSVLQIASNFVADFSLIS